jgi:hypothetical protein
MSASSRPDVAFVPRFVADLIQMVDHRLGSRHRIDAAPKAVWQDFFRVSE